MIAKKKTFFYGAIMMLIFIVVLIIIFSPVFGDKNGLEYLDDLYNSISKGSAYYIPKVKQETDRFIGKSVTMTLDLGETAQAEQTALLLAIRSFCVMNLTEILLLKIPLRWKMLSIQVHVSGSPLRITRLI